MAVISDKIIELLNYRINQEEQSARIYQAMSQWLNFKGFSGASKLWKKYSLEELIHADWAVEFLLSLNLLPELRQIQNEVNDYTGLKQIVALSYKHELLILSQCKVLSKTAFEEGDFLTFTLAQKYVSEQIEELDKLQYWIDRLALFGDDNSSLLLIDNEMGLK